MRFILGLSIGLLWSNFAEWFWHKHAMHWPSFYSQAAEEHAFHHRDPSAKEYVTMGFWAWVGIFAGNLALFAVPDLLWRWGILPGIAAGFALYIFVGVEIHKRIHDGRWVPEVWRAHHLEHHRSPRKNFNVWLPIFDWIFKTSHFNRGGFHGEVS